MKLRPRRPRASATASFAVLLALAVALVALLGSAVRPPDAVLRVAFARACRAEAAGVENAPRRMGPRLRADREDARAGDVPSLAPGRDAVKAPPGAGGARALVTPTAIASILPLDVDASNPGLDVLPVARPARARALRMVFLN